MVTPLARADILHEGLASPFTAQTRSENLSQSPHEGRHIRQGDDLSAYRS